MRGAGDPVKPSSLEDFLARPMLVDPLRVEDCCLISDGGGAYVMTSAERARDLRKPPVIVAGVGDGLGWQLRTKAQERRSSREPSAMVTRDASTVADDGRSERTAVFVRLPVHSSSSRAR